MAKKVFYDDDARQRVLGGAQSFVRRSEGNLWA